MSAEKKHKNTPTPSPRAKTKTQWQDGQNSLCHLLMDTLSPYWYGHCHHAGILHHQIKVENRRQLIPTSVTLSKLPLQALLSLQSKENHNSTFYTMEWSSPRKVPRQFVSVHYGMIITIVLVVVAVVWPCAHADSGTPSIHSFTHPSIYWTHLLNMYYVPIMYQACGRSWTLNDKSNTLRSFLLEFTVKQQWHSLQPGLSLL